MKTLSYFIEQKFNLKLKNKIKNLCLVDHSLPDSLTFASENKYFKKCINNNDIKSVIVSEDILMGNKSTDIKKKDFIISSDPINDFFKLYNEWVDYKEIHAQNKPNIVSPKSSIHSSVLLSGKNVIIENDVTIKENVVIHDNVTIKKGTIVYPNVVLGVDGYEFKKTDKEIYRIKHDGNLVINENVEIGSNCVIARGFSFIETIIGEFTKIDSNVHISHGVQIGKRNLIAAGTNIGGSTSIGDNNWIGISSVISNGIKIGNDNFIGLGSVVVGDIKSNQKVSGNFAIDHNKFLLHHFNKLKINKG